MTSIDPVLCHRRTPLRSIAAAVSAAAILVVGTAATEPDDSDAAGAEATVVETTDVATTVAGSSTPESSTPESSVPESTVAVGPQAGAARPVPGLPFDGQPTFAPATVLAPTTTNPWLLIGTERPAPGLPSVPAVFVASPDQPATWQRGGRPTRPDGESSAVPYTAVDAVDLADGTALVLGTAERQTGSAAVAWAIAAGQFSAPVDVGTAEAATFVAGTASAQPDGSVVAVARSPQGYELARRDAGGSWATAALPFDPAAFVVRGVAVNDTTLVVVGTAVGGDLAAPAAFVSVDDGASWAAADTSSLTPVSLDGSFSGAVTGPGGFYAATCTEVAGVPTVTVAYSPDGLAWAVVEGATSTDGPASANCGRLALDPGGGVWFARSGGQIGELVRLVDGQTAIRLAYAVPSSSELVSEPAVFDSDGLQVVGAVPTFGGTAVFTQALAVADASGQSQLTQVTSPIAGKPTFAGLDVRDDRGSILYVNAFPQLVALADGSTTWSTQTRSFLVADDGSVVGDDAVNVVDVAERRGRAIIVTTDGAQVALVNRSEFDVAADPAGSGDVAVLSRPAGGSWSAPQPLLQEPGDQFIVAAAAVAGDRVVAVGRSLTTDPESAATMSTPLILVGDGTTFQRVGIAAEFGDFVASAVCPLGSGGALVVGRSASTGAWLSATIDTTALTATVAPATLDVGADDLLVDCAYNAGDPDRPLVARSSTAVYSSADGVVWDEVAAAEPGWRFQRLVVGPAGVATVENTGGEQSDLQVRVGERADELVIVDSPEFVGAGSQEGSSASVRDDGVLVFGSINERPVIWRVEMP